VGSEIGSSVLLDLVVFRSRVISWVLNFRILESNSCGKGGVWWIRALGSASLSSRSLSRGLMDCWGLLCLSCPLLGAPGFGAPRTQVGREACGFRDVPVDAARLPLFPPILFPWPSVTALRVLQSPM
jgi:hypothetical protein